VRRWRAGAAPATRRQSIVAQQKLKHVWMVEDAPTREGAEPRQFWTKIGVAHENADGSLTLQLAAVPVTGKMIIRDPSPALSSLGKRGAA
jgi:hypothetical protein